jgi:pyruvate dehydrogenase E1 component alpha subunit
VVLAELAGVVVVVLDAELHRAGVIDIIGETWADAEAIIQPGELAAVDILRAEADFKAIDAEIEALVEDSVEFADASPKPDMSQLLENVFADPKGFGIAADGRYRFELPGFSSGTSEVS